MTRRLVIIKKDKDIGTNMSLEKILEKNNDVRTMMGKFGLVTHKYSYNTVFHLNENFTEDNIYLITQIFIHRQEKRRKEIKYCLSQNCKIFEKIILLNERIYSQEELGVDDEGWKKIVQINIEKRLSYKKFLDYISESGLKGYFILSNTDIFFDKTVFNLRKSFMSVEKSIFAISRFQYKSDGSTTEEHLLPDCQDTWIIHSNYFAYDTEKYDYNLGVPGCDNRISMMFYSDDYKIYNCPYFIKTYHYHEDEERDYTHKDIIPGPYYYPHPVTTHRKVSSLIDGEDKLKKILESNQIFWQYPVITEKRYKELNKSNENYLGIPWATMIDFNINFKIFEGLENKNYTTCCQHIHFRKVVPAMKKLGVNVLYTPHKIIGEDIIDGIEIRSCPLYAVNFEDQGRNSDFQGKDFLEVERKYLYSFRGGWNRGYMSNIRKRIFQLEKKGDTLIEDSGGWHFERTVYGGEQNKNGTYQKGGDVESYNQILLNSRYSLCPSGSGPNSIRFWESLACGSIPVLLSDHLDLPLGVNWEEAVVRVKEQNVDNLDLILRNISLEEERNRREKCLEFYQYFRNFKVEIKKEKYDKIISYCCGSYERGDFGGVARYDYHLSLAFKDRIFFRGPQEKGNMLKFLERCKNPLIITDNHLSIDIPNKYDVLLVHHGSALTHAERDPDWSKYWKDLCCNGQEKMLSYRDPKKTKIVSPSTFCIEEFSKYFRKKYEKFEKYLILHSSDLIEDRYKKVFNYAPIILGNWNDKNKGGGLISNLQRNMKNFTFRKLSISCNGKNFQDFNKRKQDIYLECDIFLQISMSEGNSYATLDALLCGLVIVASNVGLFYKDVPDNCFIKLEWEKNKDHDYVKQKILEGWERREELSKNCRQWYLDNCRFIDWEKKMNEFLK
jgi:hypothetical protein